ncbi:MAG: hypothetical protein KAG53_01345 [Endozoicomonadaceae bacterium]|nr:hypothetical protein [Endozoicomonadaceae bacterium]
MKQKILRHVSSFKKYLNVPKGKELSINQEEIEKSAQWDGLHGIITNAKENIEDILAHYRDLW